MTALSIGVCPLYVTETGPKNKIQIQNSMSGLSRAFSLNMFSMFTAKKFFDKGRLQIWSTVLREPTPAARPACSDYGFFALHWFEMFQKLNKLSWWEFNIPVTERESERKTERERERESEKEEV